MSRRLLIACGLAVALLLSSSDRHLGMSADAASSIPASLTDQEFWALSRDASEPNGYFRSENLTSNEMLYETVIPDLVRRTRPGGVYLGVGPEQNFTYIAALRPSLAVIVDVRRGNLLIQLLYKALFEMARDRAEFVSLLFARSVPATVTRTSSAAEIFEAFSGETASDVLYRDTLMDVEERLTVTHHLPLTDEDLHGIESIYRVFYRSGFAVRFSPTYADLMTATDADGVARSFLATEAAFAAVKDLEVRNLVVPVVGDFAGSRAIRRIGDYLSAHGAVVSAFYLSNVEQYLYQDGKGAAFCHNVATLPLDGASTFIRSASRAGFGRRLDFISTLGEMMAEVRSCR